MKNDNIEISRLLSERITKNPYVVSTYTKNNNSSFGIYQGYVVHTDLQNHLQYRYNVKVPELFNETLTNLPVMIPGADGGANGVGHKVSLKPGQPVLVSFMNGNAATAFILGGSHLRGNIDSYVKGIPPGIDDVDTVTGRAIYPPPNNPILVKANGEAISWTVPLNARGTSKIHGSGTSVGVEVPGSNIVYDYQGNTFRVTVGKNFDVNLNLGVVDTIGFKKSIANLPIEESIKAVQEIKRIIRQSEKKYYVLSDGKYVKKSDHPDKSKANINESGTQAFEELQNVIEKFESVSNLLSSAGFMSKGQLSFLQSTVLRYAKSLETIWGKIEDVISENDSEVENPGSDLEAAASASRGEYDSQLEIPVKAGPIDIRVDPSKLGKSLGGSIASIGTDLIKNKLLGGTDSIITGEGQGAPTPLSTEGSLIVGGKKKPSEVIGVLNNKVLPIYRVISSELNDLDIVNLPSDQLISKLFDLGVNKAKPIVDKLQQFKKVQSIFSFISLASDLVPDVYSLAMSLGSVRLGKNREKSIEEFERDIRKPSVQKCPVLPKTAYDAFLMAENEDDEALENFFSEVLYLDPVNFNQWVVDPSKIADWLDSNNLSAGQAMRELLDGKIFEFLVNVVQQESKVDDLSLFSRDINQLSLYNRRCFELGVLGTENIYRAK